MNFILGLLFLFAAVGIGAAASLNYETPEEKNAFLIKGLFWLFLAYFAYGFGYFILAPALF